MTGRLTRFGDYEILDELGRGGMGRVYRVRNVISDRLDAMKVLLPGILPTDELAERFLREIKVLAALDHPNIAALRTALSADGQVAMVMELVDGESLSKRLVRGPIAPEDAVAVTRQVLAALGYAHQCGVIHRDVKPANIMVMPDGAVKLTDFGIARSANDPSLTATGTTAGSLSYMSPEQVNGSSVDARSDLYSLGVSLYEMVTGQPPFKGSSEFAVMAAHLREPPAPPTAVCPTLPAALSAIILRAIAKDPAERYQSAAEFSMALQAWAAPVPAAAETVLRPSAARIAASDASAPVQTPAAAVPASGASSAAEDLESLSPVRIPARLKRTPHPILYVTAGAVIVIAAAAATGSYLRRAEAGSARTSESSDGIRPSERDTRLESTARSAPDRTEERQTSSSPVKIEEFASASAPPALPKTGTSPARRGRDRVPSGEEGPGAPSGAATSAGASAPGTPQGVAALAGAPDPAAALDRIEREIDQLSVRAASVNDSLDRLREEQARQGLGLRSDVSASQRAMDLNLSRAVEAHGRGDTARADRYRALAAGEVDALEKFLGR